VLADSPNLPGRGVGLDERAAVVGPENGLHLVKAGTGQASLVMPTNADHVLTPEAVVIHPSPAGLRVRRHLSATAQISDCP
jgi:hypothetical protein